MNFSDPSSRRSCEQFADPKPNPIMKDTTKRSILRWIHLVFGIPIIGYVYGPFAELPNYAPVVRFVAIPVIALTGLWMWKGHVLRRLTSNRAAQPASTLHAIQQ
jgi:hypothetical protein